MPDKKIGLLVSVFLMFFSSAVPALPGLTPAGMQTLGIMAGAVILWLTNGNSWTNFMILLAMMMIPEKDPLQVISGSFGNDTAVFICVCFMLSASLTRTGIVRKAACLFVSNRLGRKSPWWTIGMYFTGVFLISMLLPSPTAFMIFLPFMGEMLHQVGYRHGKNHAAGAMMVLGTAVNIQLAGSCTPVSHPISIAGISLFENYTGQGIPFTTYCMALIPPAAACSAAWFLYAKYIWKPDVSRFSHIDFKALEDSSGSVTRRGKIAAVTYLVVVILWLLPGLADCLPGGFFRVMDKIHPCIPPFAAVILLNLVRVENAPVLSFQEALSEVNWQTYIFIATVMELGAILSDPETGIPGWLSSLLGPVFEGMNPLYFVIAVCIFSLFLTNFVSNAVGLSVNYTVMLPLCQTLFSGTVSTMAIGLLITASSQYGWATPASSPVAAMAAGSGWIRTNTMIRHGLAVTALFALVFCLVGIPCAGAL